MLEADAEAWGDASTIFLAGSDTCCRTTVRVRMVLITREGVYMTRHSVLCAAILTLQSIGFLVVAFTPTITGGQEPADSNCGTFCIRNGACEAGTPCKVCLRNECR